MTRLSDLPPVKLPDSVEILDVRADGDPADFERWPLANRPGKDRPTIEITLLGTDGETTLVLPSHAIAPHQIDSDGNVAAARMPIDLDAAGRHRGEW